jgi:alcohol dehydrogenase (cytochrome c)
MRKNVALCFEVLIIIIIALIIDLTLFNTAALSQSQIDKKQQQQSVFSSFNTQGGGLGNISNSFIYNSSTSSFSGTIDIPKGSSLTKNGPFYLPENIQVPINSKVTWANKDSLPHTATDQNGYFDTGIIPSGHSSTVPFVISKYAPGAQFNYYCIIHPWMKASLTLLPLDASATAIPQIQVGKNVTSSLSSNAPTTATMPTHSAVVKVLPKSSNTTLGTETKHQNDWITANHDILGTRSSPQTIIGKNNVNKLQVKWIFHSDFPIENPPLVIGDRGYTIDNGMRVMAFDVNTGLNIWKYDPGAASKQAQIFSRGVFTHGITYDNGVIFAGTGANATIVAINATDGKLIWQSIPIGDPDSGYRTPGPPTVWKDIVIAGSALGDNPPFPSVQGKVTAFNRTNGEKIWSMQTTVGHWVEGLNSTINGGAATWSGGSLDPKAGIFYAPAGNPSPDFNATSRAGPNLYSGSMLAIDARTGHLVWYNQLIKHDTHDWDAAWSDSLATTKTGTNETNVEKKVVIGGTKRGEAYALDAADGKVLWNDTVAVQYNTGADAQANGSGTVWPGPGHGVEAFTANDNQTAYFAVSNMAANFFSSQGGHADPVFDAIENGIGNGTITAIDINTGKIKWVYPTEFPTAVSPAVTNGIVFSGHMTATGKPYSFNEDAAPINTPLNPSGIIVALDKDTGKKIWEFNVGAPVGIGGPSIGHGMLFVTTGFPAGILSNKGGDIIAFGLPTTTTTVSGGGQ